MVRTVIKHPAENDPRWQEWSAPLHQYLDQPRNWKDLQAWVRSMNQFKRNPLKFRQCLAWLEGKGLACSGYTLDIEVYWICTSCVENLEFPLFESLWDAQEARKLMGPKKRAVYPDDCKPSGEGDQDEEDDGYDDDYEEADEETISATVTLTTLYNAG